MKRLTRFSFVILIAATPVLSQSPTGVELFAWVRGIEGRSPQGRRDFVLQELKKMGISPSVQPFSKEVGKKKRVISGENISVTMGKGTETIVVGAHVDAVPGSPGANDNGGGVAVVLGLIQALKDHPWNYRVFFCFFDQEEVGLVGSQAFVESYADSLNHLAMINLDIEGMGSEVYVGPAGGGDDDFLMPLVRHAASETGYPLHESEHYPPSDHLSFARRNLENISISVVPKGDVALITRAVESGWKVDPENMPEVMKVMHTPEDKSDHVSPDALMISFRFAKTVLQIINGTN